MQKLEFLQQPLLGEFAMSWKEREKKKEKKMPPTFTPTAKGSAHTPLGPIYKSVKLYMYIPAH